jgi:DNA-binding NarL/FixJ family response regulator
MSSHQPNATGAEPATSSLRVVVADNQPQLRKKLCLLLQTEDLEVIAEVEGMLGALDQLKGARPHVLVLDLDMLLGASHETLGRLRARAPETQVVLVTIDDSPALAQHALSAGASGVVLKKHAEKELASAVRAVASGARYVSPAIKYHLAPAAWNQSPEGVAPMSGHIEV